MLYYFIRPITRLAICLYYRKIHLSNFHKIPRNKAIILASNHPTAFMEPCMMAVFMPQPLHFLVRGDFFQKPIFNFLLRSLKMVPIYRMIDLGYKGLKNNYATFSACYTALNHHQTIMIFPEGNTTHEKRLRPLQKGIARIVAGTFQEYPGLEELYVVPVAVNFTYADQPRGNAMIDIGDPIPTRALFEQNAAAAATSLTRTLQHALEDRLVIIREEADEQVAEQLLVLHRSERTESVLPIRDTDISALLYEKRVTDILNVLSDDEKQFLRNACGEYFHALDGLQLEDWSIAKGLPKEQSLRWLFVVSALPAYLGRIFAALPVATGWHIRKTKVERAEFFSPILLASLMGAFFLYYLWWITLSILLGSWFVLGLALLLGGFAVIDLFRTELGKKLRQASKARKMPLAQRQFLQQQRASILSEFRRFSDSHPA